MSSGARIPAGYPDASPGRIPRRLAGRIPDARTAPPDAPTTRYGYPAGNRAACSPPTPPPGSSGSTNSGPSSRALLTAVETW